MEYKILSKRGVIVTRQPEAIFSSLTVTFTGAPVNATAIFKSPIATVYRQLSDSSCTVPLKALLNETEVTLTVLNGQANPPVYKCEGLKSQALESGEILVMPNDGDLPQIVVDIQVEIKELKDQIAELSEKQSEFEEKLEALIEGYDIT